MAASHLWLIDRPPATIRIFGGGPGLAVPWSDAEIEALVAASDVFWCEVPKLEGDVQHLAIKYGVDPAAPLATWLTPEDLARVEKAAVALDQNPQILAAVRPWLAAQILKMAHESAAGLQGEFSAEQRLESVAERAGIPIRSEFESGDGVLPRGEAVFAPGEAVFAPGEAVFVPGEAVFAPGEAVFAPGEAVFAAFSAWPRQAEIDRLRSVLDDIDAGPASITEQADAWLADDLALAEQIDQRYRRDYPALYETLIVARNHAWVERIKTMVTEPNTAFILMGTGHLVGPDGVLSLLEVAGISAKHA